MPDYWLPQYTRDKQHDASDYAAVRSYENAWEALARAVRESKPVLAAAFGDDLPDTALARAVRESKPELAAAFGGELRDAALKQCRKMASDWHGDPYRQDYQEYVSVALVWACGKEAEGKPVAGMRPAVVSTAVKNAILDFIYGEYPCVYGCGPDVWQRSNAKGKREWKRLDIQIKAPVADTDDSLSALDLESQKQGYGRTRGADGGDAVQHGQ